MGTSDIVTNVSFFIALNFKMNSAHQYLHNLFSIADFVYSHE